MDWEPLLFRCWFVSSQYTESMQPQSEPVGFKKTNKQQKTNKKKT